MSSENSSSEKLNWVEKQFHMKELGTNVKKETLAGITTFVSMAYILFVNPSVLGCIRNGQGSRFHGNGLVCDPRLSVDGIFGQLPDCNCTWTW